VKISNGSLEGKIPPSSSSPHILTHPSVCKQNAENAHTLIHCNWHLNDWVVSHLEMEGECEPKKLAERDKMNSKRRHKYANAIVDRWQAEGVIKGLYKDFKTAKDTARELPPPKRGGWT